MHSTQLLVLILSPCFSFCRRFLLTFFVRWLSYLKKKLVSYSFNISRGLEFFSSIGISSVESVSKHQKMKKTHNVIHDLPISNRWWCWWWIVSNSLVFDDACWIFGETPKMVLFVFARWLRKNVCLKSIPPIKVWTFLFHHTDTREKR